MEAVAWSAAASLFLLVVSVVIENLASVEILEIDLDELTYMLPV